MVIFNAFKLNNYIGGAHVDLRFSAIEDHYRIKRASDVKTRRLYDEKNRVGCHVMWQDFTNEDFEHLKESDDRLVLVSGAPYGYSSLLGDKPLDLFELADALRNFAALRCLHPPFFLLDFDKSQSSIKLFTDVAGYARTYHTVGTNGICLSNRPIAPHFVLLKTPRLSDLAWAAEQRNGYMFDTLSPYEGVFRNKPGAIATLSRNDLEMRHDRSVVDWFRSAPPNPFDGLERLAREVKRLAKFDQLDVAITGGRDSRASAAFAFAHFPNEAHGRTNYPPALEKIMAKDLVSRLPRFERFQNDDRAKNQQDATLWRGMERKQSQLDPISVRARKWAYAYEGSGISSSLYSNCTLNSPFSTFGEAHFSVAGNGGEFAKAYGYHPSQVSGVYAKNTKEWLAAVKKIPVHVRLPDHQLVRPSPVHFARPEYSQQIDEMILAAFLDARDSGIEGYRFFDYWLLVGRMAGAQMPGATPTKQILPFLVPEFIQAGGMDTLERKVLCQLNEDIVCHYMPSWAGQPYYDQIQNSVPMEQTRFFRNQEMLWSGTDANFFFQVLNESSSLEAPYDRAALLDVFQTTTDGPGCAALNVKGHSLMYRHGVYELAQDVGQKIAELREIRLRRW